MLYGEAMQTLRQNQLKKLYLIAGEEKYLADKFLRALWEKLLPEGNKNDITRLDETASVNDIIEACSTMPFFCGKNIIYLKSSVLFKEKKSKNAEKNEALLLALFADMPKFTTFILETDEKIDKRRKLFKIIAQYGLIVEVEPIKPYRTNEIGAWLKSKFREIGKTPDAESYQYLLSTIGLMPQVSLGFLDKELDKLALFTERRDIRKTDLLNVLSGLPEISVFALTEALGDKDIKKVLRLLEQERERGAQPIVILSLLVRHVRQLWQINYYLSQRMTSDGIAKKMRLHPFIAKKMAAQARKFTAASLRRAVCDFADADYKLKSGQTTPVLLEDILIRMCR